MKNINNFCNIKKKKKEKIFKKILQIFLNKMIKVSKKIVGIIICMNKINNNLIKNNFLTIKILIINISKIE